MSQEFNWIEPGEKAYFRDPDGTGTSSGFYKIHEVRVPGGDDPDDNVIYDDTMVILQRDDGVTMEVFAHELHRVPDFGDVMSYFGLDDSFQWSDEQVDEHSAAFIESRLAEERNQHELAALRTLYTMVKSGSPDDVREAMEAVDRVRAGESDVRPVNVVLEINGGVINCVRSDAPVRVVLLDEDTEGGDQDRIADINGSEVYVHDYLLTAEAEPGMFGIDPAFVNDTMAQVDDVFGDEDCVMLAAVLTDTDPDDWEIVEEDGQRTVLAHVDGRRATVDGDNDSVSFACGDFEWTAPVEDPVAGAIYLNHDIDAAREARSAELRRQGNAPRG